MQLELILADWLLVLMLGMSGLIARGEFGRALCGYLNLRFEQLLISTGIIPRRRLLNLLLQVDIDLFQLALVDLIVPMDDFIRVSVQIVDLIT